MGTARDCVPYWTRSRGLAHQQPPHLYARPSLAFVTREPPSQSIGTLQPQGSLHPDLHPCVQQGRTRGLGSNRSPLARVRQSVYPRQQIPAPNR